MALLTFSQFAKVLLPYCGSEGSETQFVKTLTNKIMQGKPGAKTYDGKCRNPLLNKSNRAIQYYFTGERSISRRDASVIFSSSDRYKFEEYLRHQCSEDGLSHLKKELVECLPQGTIKEECDIIEFCADLFVDILKDLASGKGDKRQKNL